MENANKNTLDAFLESIKAYLVYREHQAFTIEDRKRTRNALYRKWFLAGHLPKDNPRGSPDPAVRERQAAAERDAFIGPHDKVVFDVEGNHDTFQSHLNEEKRLRAAIVKAARLFYSTPDGQHDLALRNVAKAAERQHQRDQKREQERAYIRVLRTAPCRYQLSERQAHGILRERNQLRKLPRALRVAACGGPIFDKKSGHIVDFEDGRRRWETSVLKPLSPAEGALWKLEAEGWTAPYLIYVETAEAAGVEPVNRKVYMKRQLKARKTQKPQVQLIKIR